MSTTANLEGGSNPPTDLNIIYRHMLSTSVNSYILLEAMQVVSSMYTLNFKIKGGNRPRHKMRQVSTLGQCYILIVNGGTGTGIVNLCVRTAAKLGLS